MILDYLLWIATWPILILYWILPTEDNQVPFRPLRNLALSQTTPFLNLKLQDTPSDDPTRNTPTETNVSTTLESRAKQDDRPHSSHSNNSAAAVLSPKDAISDAASTCLGRILEIIPDVEPGHATRLITIALPKYGQDDVLERVLHTLFEKPNYPKVESSKSTKRGKSKNSLVNTGSSSKTKFGFGYGNKSRPFTGGANYGELALKHLQHSFYTLSEDYLRESLNSFNGFYAPTHVFLVEKSNHQNIRLPCNTFGTNGKLRELYDEEFDKEREWVLEVMAEDDECEDGIECGCCFAKFRFRKMIQCPETHLFCSNCMRAYAASLLGTQNPDIQCLDLSGCKALISESELKRFLPDEMLRLWERARQRKDIQAAGLKGLEECPFCDYSVIIESSEERLLRCGNKEVCGVVSCRACKKPNHLPLRCGEEEEDRYLGGRHTVEEAMSRALVRSCPSCNRSIVKTDGCNSMKCLCGKTWCYLCRQYAMDRYHNTCHTELTSDKLHAKEVKAARDRAVLEFKRSHPDIDEKKIRVDL